MNTTQSTPTPLDVARMSHRNDPDTSIAAAMRAARGTKVAAIQTAILRLLATGPATPKELHEEYLRRHRADGWPTADLQDIRRRLTELQHDFHMVVDTRSRRTGERVMALAPETAASTSGDYCLLRVVNGRPCAVHYDCDDYADGTVTDVVTGEQVPA